MVRGSHPRSLLLLLPDVWRQSLSAGWDPDAGTVEKARTRPGRVASTLHAPATPCDHDDRRTLGFHLSCASTDGQAVPRRALFSGGRRSAYSHTSGWTGHEYGHW